MVPFPPLPPPPPSPLEVLLPTSTEPFLLSRLMRDEFSKREVMSLFWVSASSAVSLDIVSESVATAALSDEVDVARLARVSVSVSGGE